MWIREVFEAIESERTYQDLKHGKDGHEIGTWILLIESELNEAKLAAVKGGTGRDFVMREILQVAALAVAAIQQYSLEEFKGRAI